MAARGETTADRRGGRGTDRRPGTAGAVALGGAAGVLCGAGVMNAVTALAGAPNFRGTFGAAFGAVDVLVQALPLFVVNVLGSFLLGLLWAASRRRGPDWRPRLVAGLGTGFLGAFTTISSAVALLLWPVRLGAAASGAGGVLAAAASVLLVLALMAALSTAAAVLGLRAGGAPGSRVVGTDRSEEDA